MSTISIPIESYISRLDSRASGEFLVPGEPIVLNDMVATIVKRLPNADNLKKVLLEAAEIIIVFHKAILAGQCFTRSDLTMMKQICKNCVTRLRCNFLALQAFNETLGYPERYICRNLMLSLNTLIAATNDI